MAPAHLTMTHGHSLRLQKMFWMLSVVLLAIGVQQVTSADGGLKVQVTQEGLNYGKEFGLRMLTSLLKKDQIQNMSSSYKVPLLGDIKYSITGAHVKDLQVNNASLAFSEGTGVNLTIQDAQILFKGNWMSATILGSQSGTADLNVSQLSLSTALGIGKDDTGRPQVWFSGCQSAIRDLKLTFYGGSSWLYNVVASTAKEVMKSQLNKQLCLELKKGIGELAKTLKTLKVSAPVDSTAEIDYSVVDNPEIHANRCKAELKGEFFLVGQTDRSPFLPAPFLLPSNSSSMVLLGISESVVNSAAFVYYTAGALQVNYTDKKIPKTFPLRLNTKNVGLFVPELKKLFPSMALEIHVAAQKAPLLSFRPGGVDAKLASSVELFVVLPNASLASVFILNIHSNLTGQLFLEPVKSGNSLGKVVGSVSLKGIRLSQEWSRIGDVKLSALEKLLKFVSPLISSRINRHLKKGIVLPKFYDSSFLNPKVSMHEGYMLIETDLHHRHQTPV